MCTGIALDRQDVSDHLIEEYDLQQQLTTRGEGGRQEVQFRFQDKKARLPVQNGPQLMVLEWGNRDNKASRLYLLNLQKLFSSDVIKAFKEKANEQEPS